MVLALVVGPLLGRGLAAEAPSAPGPGDAGLRTIQTRYFTIIHGPEATASARRLASFADSLYEEAAHYLGVEPDLRLPVYFQTEAELLNGSYSPLPYPRILLIQAHLSPGQGFALYDDPLKSLFLHELVHAISLNIGAPGWKVLSGIFFQGGLGVPFYTAPMNFVEGVTVWSESLGGQGRANDTPYAAVIQQDIIEGRFKSFVETSGMLTDAPGGLWYIYGGWFSRYLMETYGLETYRRLWQGLATFRTLTPGPFHPGLLAWETRDDFDTIWEGFRRWIAIKQPVSTDLRPLESRPRAITALTAHDDLLYLADSRGVHALDPRTGESRLLMGGLVMANRLSVSPDGSRLLVSGAARKDAQGSLAYRLWVVDLVRGGWEVVETPPRLSEAAWDSQGGIIAIGSRGYTADLIRLSLAEGPRGPCAREAEVVYRGEEGVVPSLPAAWDKGILFIVGDRGHNRLVNRSPDGTLEALASPPDLPLTGIRHLWARGNDALFIHDHDLSLFKLGRLGADGSLRIQTTPLSGGIQYPVQARDQVYYLGLLSRGSFLMAYPDEAIATARRFQGPWDPTDHAAPGPAPLEQSEFQATWEALHTHPVETMASEKEPEGESQPYRALPWTLFPHLRYPTLDLFLEASDPADWVRGAGLAMESLDPTGTWGIDARLGYQWREGMVPFSLGLRRAGLWGNLALGVTDELQYLVEPGAEIAARVQGLALSLDGTIPGPLLDQQASWGMNAQGLRWAGRDLDSTGTGAYSWDLSPWLVGLGIRARWNDVSTAAFGRSPQGYSLGLAWNGGLDLSEPGLPEGLASAEARLVFPGPGGNEGPGLQITITGRTALATHPEVSVGPAGVESPTGVIRYGGSDFAPWPGYAAQLVPRAPWYAGASASVGTTLGVNAAFPGPIYLSNLDVKAFYRGGWAGGVGGSWLDTAGLSLVQRLHLGNSFLSRIPLEAGLEAGWHLRRPSPAYVAWIIGMAQP